MAAPQIVCPADVGVRGVTGTSQAVTFDPPVVTGGSAPVTTSCSPAAGAAFSLGTTPVTCAAKDAMARTATCSFNVTLTGMSISVTKYETIGDSLTAGENGLPVTFVDIQNAYPTRLQAELDATYSNQGVLVFNRGVGGDTIEQTLDRLPGNLATDRPGAVLLLGGFNNLTGPCGPGLQNTTGCSDGIDHVRFGVRDCIRHTRESGLGIQYIFVSTLTPPGPSGDRRISGDAIVQANVRIRQMVAAEGAILVDSYPLFVGHESDYVDTDGLHLTPAGYQVIADAFFAAIQAKIPQTPLFRVR